MNAQNRTARFNAIRRRTPQQRHATRMMLAGFGQLTEALPSRGLDLIVGHCITIYPSEAMELPVTVSVPPILTDLPSPVWMLASSISSFLTPAADKDATLPNASARGTLSEEIGKAQKQLAFMASKLDNPEYGVFTAITPDDTQAPFIGVFMNTDAGLTQATFAAEHPQAAALVWKAVHLIEEILFA